MILKVDPWKQSHFYFCIHRGNNNIIIIYQGAGSPVGCPVPLHHLIGGPRHCMEIEYSTERPLLPKSTSAGTSLARKRRKNWLNDSRFNRLLLGHQAYSRFHLRRPIYIITTHNIIIITTPSLLLWYNDIYWLLRYLDGLALLLQTMSSLLLFQATIVGMLIPFPLIQS